MSESSKFDPKDLFRAEAIMASADRLSRPVAPLALPSWALVSFAMIVFFATCVFIGVGTYARKETVSGRVVAEGGVLELIPTKAGIVDRVLVGEGQAVRAGDVIATFRSDSTLVSGELVSTRVSESVEDQFSANMKDLAAQRARLVAQREEIRIRRTALSARVRMISQEIDIQQERVALAKSTVKSLRPLLEAQQISLIQYRQYEVTLLDARQVLTQLMREKRSANDDILQLKASDAVLLADAESIEAKYANALAVLEERQVTLDGQRGHALVSPVDGFVAALTMRSGDSVALGQSRAIVVPRESPLLVELWIPTRAVGFVKVGQTVRLMYDAFPYQRFGFGNGTVASVGAAPFPSGQTLGGGLPASEPLFRALVEIQKNDITAYGEQHPILPGMTLSATLILEERSFFDWIIDPLRAARLRT